ncbi:sodium:calcium antiporter [Dethiobacter alkaliphilus]|uniref:Sodium/calcium exchanger membrane region n=1 Tax=Dethiobacter alkaliphilus AHT 1 TaxID=555088 RepID=C0GGF7_DETAL|nr:sodium:calcium antiporter [Dethiobacter alkaliphilus]EEG77587.1 sodium/calcium exchanger membrane region [Dethiobacter alkaliphilus AHT 1]
MLILWLQFLASAILIIAAGTKLTRSADTIAEHTGLGALWAGVFLLPLATSLPELVTSWRAAVILAPDLSVGNVFGSNMFNVAIIAIIDLTQGRGPLLTRVSQRHVFTAAVGIMLTCYVAIIMLVPTPVTVGWVGLNTLFLPVFYVLGNWLLTRFERRHAVEAATIDLSARERSLGKAIFWFMVAAAVIIVAGISLADSGDAIARETGLGQTLVGSFFIAITTSLPELVTTLTAVRMGVLDMAIGNIFGANLFNVLIIFFADLFYTGGSIMHVISGDHLVSAMMSVILTSIAVAGMIYRSQRSFVRLGFDSMAIVAGYVVAMILLFFA